MYVYGRTFSNIDIGRDLTVLVNRSLKVATQAVAVVKKINGMLIGQGI